MGTKPMTLAKTWKECLRMWKWIVKEIDKGVNEDVSELKERWLQTHGYGEQIIDSNCFFCQYAAEHEEVDDFDCCLHCPGKMVSKRFICASKSYHYEEKPKKFYQKLLQLDAKRRGKK